MAEIARRVQAIPIVALGFRAFTRYTESGGGVMARGLAYSILFAVVPALLLVASLATVFVSDADARARLLSSLAAQFPPLAPIMADALDAAISAAPTVTIVSTVMLVWTASGVIRALDMAMTVVFHEQAVPRGPIRLVLMAVVVAAAALAVTGMAVVSTLSGPIGDLIGIGATTRVAAVAIWAIPVILVYRYLPVVRPSWGAVILPGIVVALGVTVLTSTFTLLTPILFGSASLYGAFAVFFIAMIWLSLATDLFMICAAWAALRAEDARARAADPGV